MTHGSLFSGIGGFDLAAEWMGWHNLFHCEWNPFGQKVLKYYWPNAESFEDITKTNFTKYANKIDIISGGFPCQPYSNVGKRKGKEDSRHLWPEMLRAIEEISPRFVVGENVRGLTNWNRGLVFDEVCVEMENLGYQVAPVIIPASACNAPHQRERIWFVAHSKSDKNRKQSSTNTRWQDRQFNNTSKVGNVTDTMRERLQRSLPARKYDSVQWSRSQKKIEQFVHSFESRVQFENFPTQPPLCGGNDGLSTKLDGITFSKWRNESLKAYGNAIVPNVAYEIFKVIQKIDDEKILLGL